MIPELIRNAADVPCWSVIVHNSGGGLTMKSDHLTYKVARDIFNEYTLPSVTELFSMQFYFDSITELHFNDRMILCNSISGWIR